MKTFHKKSPARGQNRLLFSPISCKMKSAFREHVSRSCRDGGAAERARFEIVLGSDVYQGSNPCLCATENGVHFGRLRFSLHEYDRDLRVEAFAGANALRADCLLTYQLGAN